MARTLNAPPAGAERRDGPAAARPERRWWGPDRPLVLVAGAFAVVQLALVGPGMGLGWDETVYVSQVSGHSPAAFFSAPRSRGVSLLVAPIASWSSSTPLLRTYLALLSGLGLLLALRAWRGVLPVRVTAGAGALFATLWVTVFYGPQAMPNLWVALGALAAVGCFLRARADHRDRAALWGVGASAALMALMRPADAVWITLPLFALLVRARERRRPALPAALVLGLGAGAAQWIAEAYATHGGPRARLADASAIQGGLGWNIAVKDQLRTLAGRSLCRPCDGSVPDAWVIAWWFVLPLLALLGTVLAVRAGRGPAALLPLACATTAGIPYLFMIGYAAPRFLLAFYALLAVPAAYALTSLVASSVRARRPVGAVLVALGLVGHLTAQYAVLHGAVERTTASHRDWARTAATLHRLGVRPPCVLTGRLALPIAYYTGCRAVQSRGHNTNGTRQDIVREARRQPVAALTAPGVPPPAFARTWETHRAGALRAHIAPSAREARDG
ncbi:hypothetical protein AB0F07_17210 [Streptomyces fructofermentans]|uniref:hypothetical protein n=1 Tax=Streptomyces fructofermentans TaxID=152141 RepID=UPI0033C9F7C1